MQNAPSSFIWYELMTYDPRAAADFYGQVLGWTSEAMGAPGVDYSVFSANGTGVAGMLTLSSASAEGSMPPCWVGYVGVDDVDWAAKNLAADGGAVHMPPTDIPNVGRFAMVSDPQGAIFYLMRGATDEPSPAFNPRKHGHGCWHELHTSDWESAFDFYSKQFGWAKSEAMNMGPMGIYQTFNAGGDAIGGMMNDKDLERPAWLNYFYVDDIDTANDRIMRSGGTIVSGPEEVPGGGWIINALDPEGVLFAVVGPRVC